MKDCASIHNCAVNHSVAFRIGQNAIHECSGCDHRYTRIQADTTTHLSEIYSDAYFFEGKDGYPNYLDEKDILIKQGERYAKLISKYATKGKILDVGAAAGFILKGFELHGWDGYGVEPNNTMAAYGRNNLNMNIVTGSLETFESDGQYDVISLIQVIGHFYDLDAALNNVYKLLKPGGLVLIESWNRSRLVARWFGKRWHEYSPPSVINWFSNTSISNLFAQHGFGFVAKGLPKKQINLKHAFTLIESKFPAFPGKQKIFTFFATQLGKFTVYYPPVDINWYLFRKPA